MDLSEDDFEHVSDIDMCDSDSDDGLKKLQESTPSSPPSLRSSFRKTVLPCSYQGCKKTFNRKSRLEEHIRSHENIRPFRCPIPNCQTQPYLRQSHLNHHIKNAHSTVRDHTCTWPDCDKSFATGTRLRRHLAAHEGREKYRCRGYDGCFEVFRKHETLKRHILSTHQQVRPYPCTDSNFETGQSCTKAFDTMEKLRAHQRSSHDATRYSCSDCVAANTCAPSFGRQEAVQNPVHFATYSELQAHIADVHPPTCEYCPTSFTTVKELNRHLEIQHGWVDPNLPREATFSCNHSGCGRVFTKKGNLNVHVKTVHERRKSFVCGETLVSLPTELADRPNIAVYGCGRAFTSKATLEDHVRSAHLNLPKLLLERRRKRKANARASQQIDAEYSEFKKKTRKDKGTKKVSALAGLTGQAIKAVANPDAKQSGDHDPSTRFSGSLKTPWNADSHAMPHKIEAEVDDAENDDWAQLSGSMVMFGNNIYHNGQEYQLSRGQYPPGLSQPESFNDTPLNLPPHGTRNSRDSSHYSACDEEPMFENFEHEPEHMNGLRNVDPILLGM